MPTTLAANALTTVERVKDLLGRRSGNDAAHDELVWLINSASAMIERFCKRRFQVRRVRHERAGSDGSFVLLRHYPIVDIESIYTGFVITSFSGTADSGSTTTVADADLTQADDYWNDADVHITVGGMRYARRVSDFDAVTDTLTLDSALPTAVSASDAYRLQLVDTGSSYSLTQNEYWIGDPAVGRVETDANYGDLVLTYWAGYETIPADLDFACAQLVNHLLSESRRPGLQSVSGTMAPSESFLLQAGSRAIDIDPKVKAILKRYRHWSLMS